MNHGKVCNFFWPGLKNPMVSPFTVKDVPRDFWGYIIFETHTRRPWMEKSCWTWSLRPWNCCMSNMPSNQQHHHLRSKNLGATFPEGWCRGHPFFSGLQILHDAEFFLLSFGAFWPMTSSWNPWNFIQFKWLAMEKTSIICHCTKTSSFGIIHWKSSKNESR